MLFCRVRSGFAAVAIVGLLATCWPLAAADTIDPGAVTEINDAELARAIVAEHKGEVLKLSGVKTLSPEAAQVLAAHDADIVLNALKTLDAEVATALAGFQHTLSLHGITTLDDDTAAALAQVKAKLSLENLESLTHVGLATKLAKQPNLLVFHRLTALNANVANAFVAAPCDLSLPMLEKLEHEGLATELLNDGRYPCVFKQLKKLKPEAAKALCALPCTLRFPAMTDMPVAVAEALAGHCGVLDVDHLQAVHPDACVALLKNDGPLDLGGCNKLVVPGQPVPAAVCHAIANHQWPLTLGDLDVIPHDLADAIRRRQHHTNLVHVAVVTAELAGGIAGKGGPNGVVWVPNAVKIQQQVGMNAVVALLAIKPRPGPFGPVGPPAIILPADLRDSIPAGHVAAIEDHVCVHFGNHFGP